MMSVGCESRQGQARPHISASRDVVWFRDLRRHTLLQSVSSDRPIVRQADSRQCMQGGPVGDCVRRAARGEGRGRDCAVHDGAARGGARHRARGGPLGRPLPVPGRGRRERRPDTDAPSAVGLQLAMNQLKDRKPRSLHLPGARGALRAARGKCFGDLRPSTSPPLAQIASRARAPVLAATARARGRAGDARRRRRMLRDKHASPSAPRGSGTATPAPARFHFRMTPRLVSTRPV